MKIKFQKIFIFIRNILPNIVQQIIKYSLGKKYGINFSSCKFVTLHQILTKQLSFWENVSLGGLCLWKVSIGRYTYTCNAIIRWSIKNPIEIGSFCSIADDVLILSYSSHSIKNYSTYPPDRIYHEINNEKYDLGKPITIGHDVWIGHWAIILPWVSIGTWAIIGAWTVVTKNVPPYAIVWGVPATIKKFRFEQHEIEKLLSSRRWEKDIWELQKDFLDNYYK